MFTMTTPLLRPTPRIVGAILGLLAAAAVGCASPTAPAPAAATTSTLLPVPATAGLTPDTASRPGDPVAPAPGSPSTQTSAERISELLNVIPVVAKLPQIPGYERSCSPGKGPLTELTAQFAQV